MRSSAKVWNWASTRFEYKEIVLDPSVDCYCIEGYYQSYKYFDTAAFRKKLDLEYSGEFPKPQQHDVAIHIRRTDYTKKNFHKVLSIDYYYNCLAALQKVQTVGTLYIFSDDLKWCRPYFNCPNVQFVSLKDELEEFRFMSQFKNFFSF